MLAAGYGRIINTASMASLLVPHPQKQVLSPASTDQRAVWVTPLCVLPPWRERKQEGTAMAGGDAWEGLGM